MSDIDTLLTAMRDQWSTPQTNNDMERLVRAQDAYITADRRHDSWPSERLTLLTALDSLTRKLTAKYGGRGDE